MTADQLEERIVQAAMAAMEGDTTKVKALATEFTTGKYANPCFAKAAHDEKLFVLREQDLNAPGTVEYWAIRYRKHNAKQNEDTLEWTFNSPEAKEKYYSALAIAREMEKSTMPRKEPD